MLLKEYQKRTVHAVREFLEPLAELRGKAAKVRELEPDLDFDWVRMAWEKCAPSRSYVPRRNGGLGEPLPSFCLKIPTGGGKTLLARVRNLDTFEQQEGSGGGRSRPRWGTRCCCCVH